MSKDPSTDYHDESPRPEFDDIARIHHDICTLINRRDALIDSYPRCILADDSDRLLREIYAVQEQIKQLRGDV